MGCPGFSLDWTAESFCSPYLSDVNYTRFRALWALIFVVHGVYDQILWIFLTEPSSGITYFYYLTHLSRIVQSLGQITEWICARECWKGTSPSSWLANISMLCFAIGQPISLLVALGYWILILPDLQSGMQVTYLMVYNHGINGLLLFMSFMLGRMPYSCANGGWVILAGVFYLGFTYVHFLLRLGVVTECGYPDLRDCPIYEQFDWHQPERTGMLALLAVAILLVVTWLYGFLAVQRDRCGRGEGLPMLMEDLNYTPVDAQNAPQTAPENVNETNETNETNEKAHEAKEEKKWPLRVPRAESATPVRLQSGP